MNRKKLPKYVSEFEDRHGTWRVRFRRKGYKDFYFNTVPWSPEFMMQYQSCMAGEAAPPIATGADKTKAGSLNALIVAYYNSAAFHNLKPSTKTTYRGIIERFREQHGTKSVAKIERKHIMAIVGDMKDTPAAANNLLDRLKALMTLALDLGMRKDDPTLRVRGFRSKSDGFHTWTEEEIAKFEARHPVGSMARLALALMLYTGQRRSDAVAMGRQHIKGDSISVCQQKTNTRLEIPLHPDLREAINATPMKNMTFLVTSHGNPFKAAGFGNWFRKRCDEAGLKHCSAHGLRKAAARRLAEAGCSNQVIKAITGHKTDKEVSRYTAAADQKRLADQAMAKTYGMDREQKLSNQTDGLDISASKALK